MTIREMTPEDWNRVFEIYKQGIDSGKTTFSTKYPTWEEWDMFQEKQVLIMMKIAKLYGLMSKMFYQRRCTGVDEKIDTKCNI